MPRIKLPFMQFYPGDWIRDTRTLSLEARGVWIDLLCAMWEAPERGKLNWTKGQFERFISCGQDREEATSIWNELMDSGICDMEMTVDSKIMTLISRRMVRDEAKRNQLLKADTKYNVKRTSGKRQSNDTKTSGIYQKSEVRSHTSEEDLKKEDPVDNSKPKPKDSEALAAACVKVCAADSQRFASGPTHLIRWQHQGVRILERTETREVAVAVILETLGQLEKALKEGKVAGDWRDYAEAIRKRVRTETLMHEAEDHKQYDPQSTGAILQKMTKA